MNYLVHLSFPTYTYHSLIILNEAQRLIDDGHEVTLLYCNTGVDHCFANSTGDAKICFICKKMQRNWLSLLRGDFKTVSYQELNSPKIEAIINALHFDYKNVSDIKRIEYKQVKIGFGALSSYISKTRILNPEMNENFRSYFNNLLRVQCEIIEFIDHYAQNNKVDGVVVLNGRHFEVRPIFDYAINSNLIVKCLEKGNSVLKDDFRAFDYTGYLPHNLLNINMLIDQLWHKSELLENDKIKLGNSFFEKRQMGLPAGDKVYTKLQARDLLPDNWDSSFRNFVVLNSSEDEFAAIGDEFDKLSFFTDQITGIKKIAALLSKETNIRLYLRVHPNLINVNFSYHTDLYKLSDEFPNLTVIAASDKISTYALIENSEKVIVFGSSTGIEAVYLDKPVILLAGSLYYYMNLCYVPKTMDELHNLLLAKLTSLKTNNVIKYGFYILSEKGTSFDKLVLNRTQRIPFTPLKINKETYIGMAIRFFYSNLLFKMEVLADQGIPKLEKSQSNAQLSKKNS